MMNKKLQKHFHSLVWMTGSILKRSVKNVDTLYLKPYWVSIVAHNLSLIGVCKEAILLQLKSLCVGMVIVIRFVVATICMLFLLSDWCVLINELNN